MLESRRCGFFTSWGSKLMSRSGRTSTNLTGIGEHRLGPLPIAGIAPIPASRIMLVVAEMFRHLLIQGSLDDRLRQRLQQPARPGQDRALSAGLSNQLPGGIQCCLYSRTY